MEDISVFIECAKKYHLIDTWLVAEAEKGQSYSCEIFEALPRHHERQACGLPVGCERQTSPHRQDKSSSWLGFQSWLSLEDQNFG